MGQGAEAGQQRRAAARQRRRAAGAGRGHGARPGAGGVRVRPCSAREGVRGRRGGGVGRERGGGAGTAAGRRVRGVGVRVWAMCGSGPGFFLTRGNPPRCGAGCEPAMIRGGEPLPRHQLRRGPRQPAPPIRAPRGASTPPPCMAGCSGFAPPCMVAGPNGLDLKIF